MNKIDDFSQPAPKKDYGSHTKTLDKGLPNDVEGIHEHLKNTRDMAFKTMMASMKNQNPLTAGDQNKSTEMVQMQSAMASAEAALIGAHETAKLNKHFAGSELTQAKQFIGHDVEWDDSKRMFAGKPVSFNYQLKYPKDGLPDGVIAHAQVNIKDAKGRLIASKKTASAKEGDNGFIWDGKNDSDIMAEDGEYSIEVDAYYIFNDNGVEKKAQISSNTNMKGKVDSVEKEDGEAKLIIGNNKINPGLVSVLVGGEKSSATGDSKSSAADMMGYLGKKADVTYDKYISDGKGRPTELKFIVPEGEELSVVEFEIYDEKNNRVAHMEQKGKFLPGEDSVLFHGMQALTNDALKTAKPLPPGNYTYKVDGKNQDDQRINLTNSKTVTIDEVGSGKLFADGEEVKSSEVKKVKAVEEAKPSKNKHMQHDQRLQVSSAFLGKKVEFMANKMFITSYIRQDGDLVLLEKGQGGAKDVQKITMRVFDDRGNEIRKIEKTDGFAYQSEAALPKFNQLSDDSKKALIDWAKNKFSKNHNDYNDFSEEEKPQIDEMLKNGFYGGEIFKTNEDSLAHRNKNMGLNEIIWDGKDSNDQDVEVGEYSFKIEVTTATGTKEMSPQKRGVVTDVSFDSDGAKLQIRNSQAEYAATVDDVYKVSI